MGEKVTGGPPSRRRKIAPMTQGAIPIHDNGSVEGPARTRGVTIADESFMVPA